MKTGSNGRTKTTYGYKDHISVGGGHFIKALGFAADNMHDSQCFTAFRNEKKSEVFANSAYASQKTNVWLEQRGVDNDVLESAYHKQPVIK
ncbi:hypothetical protein IMCC1989_9 [gamma proteobacterium IMCC1989]|nr:hypothetical protein IMCC1989_9 [gamma proteobacterium IMCC1989]